HLPVKLRVLQEAVALLGVLRRIGATHEHLRRAAHGSDIAELRVLGPHKMTPLYYSRLIGSDKRFRVSLKALARQASYWSRAGRLVFRQRVPVAIERAMRVAAERRRGTVRADGVAEGSAHRRRLDPARHHAEE